MNRKLRKKNAKSDVGSKERLKRLFEVRKIIGKDTLRLTAEAQEIAKEIDEIEK